jgi:hypothetical protein
MRPPGLRQPHIYGRGVRTPKVREQRRREVSTCRVAADDDIKRLVARTQQMGERVRGLAQLGGESLLGAKAVLRTATAISMAASSPQRTYARAQSRWAGGSGAM